MDPPTETRANQLYLQVLEDLELVHRTKGVARGAVLLRVSNRVGELAEIAEGADVAPNHEGSLRNQVLTWVARISWELLKILGDTDFYILLASAGGSHARRIDLVPRPGHETHPRLSGPVAA